MKNYKVRASYCHYQASEEELYDVLCKTTEPLDRSWQKLENAEKIVIKFNMMKPHDRIEYFEGRRRELVDGAVCRSVLRLLRERTSAKLIATDTNPYTAAENNLPSDFHYKNQMLPGFNYEHHLSDFGVEFIDSNLPPFKNYEVPNGGSMFDRYTLSECFDGENTEVISVAKMKNHLFTGITLCTKNLFGLPPITPPAGRSRSYYHHLVRLPYLLVDLANITKPCLNIVDALTGQWGREWGGEGRISNALIAGDHPIATDACGMHLMGTDPNSDWPIAPFRRARNHILIAAQRGFGTVNLEEIDFETEVDAPLSDFDSVETDPPDRVSKWLKTTCEQGLNYLHRKSELIDRYEGDFIYMQDGKVVWCGEDPSRLASRRELSGSKKDSALWLKFVDREEYEGENFEVYEKHPAISCNAI